MNGAVRIKIGASLDRSVDVVFQSVEKRARRAQDTISRTMAGGGKGGPYRAMQREAESAYRGIGTAAERAARDAERAAQRSLRNQAKGYKQLGDIAARELARGRREQERSSRNTRESFARRTAYGSMRNTGGMARGAGRIAGDLARGAGVDFSLANSVQRMQGLHTGAVNLSNAGFMNGKGGPAGVRQDPLALVAEARRVGDMAGMAPGDVMSGMQGFVKSTGDLATARAVLKDMATLSKATGSNMDEMVAAAGQVSMAFGDAAENQAEAEKRAEQVADVMRVIAGQGKLGTLEIGDLAKQMARFSASAMQFTGDRAKNLATMGALGQLAKYGGATSSHEQTRSASAFVQTLKTPARRAAFKEAGVGIDAGQGKLRNPEEIIIDAIKAAGEDTDKWNSMFKNIPGERGLTLLRQRYLEAGGGASGEGVLRAKFKEFGSGAAIGRDEEKESFNRAMETGATKAQQFQNELDRVAESMAGQVLPALEKLGPSAISLAKTLGDVATSAVNNPKTAIALAIGASVAQAGVGAVIRGAIETATKSMLSGAPVAGGPAAGGAAGLAGLAGLTLAVTALAVTATSVAITTQQSHAEENTRDAGEWLKWARKGGPEERKVADQEIGKKMKSTATGSILSSIVGTVAGGGLGGVATLAANYFGTIPELKSQKGMQDEVRGMGRDIADAMANRELKVRVVNAAEIVPIGVSVDPNTRDAPFSMFPRGGSR